MRRPRCARWGSGINGRRGLAADDAASLRAANLSAPGFQESWRAGSPLNWVEFIECWQAETRDGESFGPEDCRRGAGR
jgi:hypothetical protein